MWGSDGDTNVEFHNAITVSSKFTRSSPELAKLGRIGRFAKFVIALVTDLQAPYGPNCKSKGEDIRRRRSWGALPNL